MQLLENEEFYLFGKVTPRMLTSLRNLLFSQRNFFGAIQCHFVGLEIICLWSTHNFSTNPHDQWEYLWSFQSYKKWGRLALTGCYILFLWWNFFLFFLVVGVNLELRLVIHFSFLLPIWSKFPLLIFQQL